MAASFKKAFVLAAGVFAGTLTPAFADAPAAPQAGNAEALSNLVTTFGRVLELIESQSAVHPDTIAIATQALKDMVTKIDPHSSYMTAEDFAKIREHTSGEFGGLGMEVGTENGNTVVKKAMKDTPAEQAGIQANDIITHVEGAPVKDVPLDEVVKKMRGPAGSNVTITVERGGQSLPPMTLTRAIIEQSPVKHKTVGNIGVVHLSSFTAKASEDIEEAITAIKADLGGKLEGFVLDLRSDPGGLLPQAITISDMFIDGVKPIVHTGSVSSIDETFFASRGDILNGKPMAVLINGYSASASEIVAGALKDNGRARIFGEQSFGKGSVQTIMPLSNRNEPDLGGLRLTTQLYYTAGRTSIQGVGVTPDTVFDSEELRKLKADPEYQKSVRTEASLEGVIANPDLVHDDRVPENVCEPLKGADESKADQGLKVELRDGSFLVDYELACAVEYLRGQTALTMVKPYITRGSTPAPGPQ